MEYIRTYVHTKFFIANVVKRGHLKLIFFVFMSLSHHLEYSTRVIDLERCQKNAKEAEIIFVRTSSSDRG